MQKGFAPLNRHVRSEAAEDIPLFSCLMIIVLSFRDARASSMKQRDQNRPRGLRPCFQVAALFFGVIPKW
jgi:hypothetical protein